MTDIKQIEWNPAVVAEYQRRAKKIRLGASGDLIKAIWNGIGDTSGMHMDYRWKKGDYQNAFHAAYRELCGHSAQDCATIDDFFCRKLISTLHSFFEKEELARIRDECALIMECPYSHSIYRPSYRSRRAGAYADAFFVSMVNALNFLCYDISLEKALTSKTEPASSTYGSRDTHPYSKSVSLSGQDYRIATELRHGNKKIFALIEEAILGDNSEIQISHSILSGIVKSDDQQAIEFLGKLLLAAKGQEGLRQAILETCDSGTLSSHTYFIRMILENDLCRFSSVIRAFDTWSGLAYGDQKQKVAEKCMSLALKYLSDEHAASEGLDANDATEVYLALWSICCRDLYSATDSARRLLDSPEKYKRLVGWYFITHTNDSFFRHHMAIRYLGVRDPEELAWICGNLHINNNVRYRWYMWDKNNNRSTDAMTFYDKTYPENQAARTTLFDQLAEVVSFIGKKNTKFTESVFPWFSQVLNASTSCWVLLGLAAYDRSVDLTRRFADLLPVMDVQQRQFYCSILLDPDMPEQREVLLDGLSDKSQTVRGDIVNRLRAIPLGKADMDRLAETLTTQNADLRMAIITLFNEQKEALIRPVIKSLLDSSNKNQLIAGVELLEVFSKNNPSLREEFTSNIAALATDDTLSQDVSILLEKVTPGTRETGAFTKENGYGLYDVASETFSRSAYEAKCFQTPAVSDKELKALVLPDEKAVIALYGRISDALEKYRDYEYETENWDGTREKVLLGDYPYHICLLAGNKHKLYREDNPIHDFPLAEVWLEAAGEFASDKAKLATALSFWGVTPRNIKLYKKWFCDLYAGYPIYGNDSECVKAIAQYVKAKNVRFVKINEILNAILHTGEASIFDFAFSAYVNLVRKVPKDKLGMAYVEDEQKAGQSFYSLHPTIDDGVLSAGYLNYWRKLACEHIKTDAQFADYFNEMWYEYLSAGQQCYYGLSDEHIFRANQMGLIADEAVCHYFTAGMDAPIHMQNATGPYVGGRELLARYPAVEKLLDTAIDRIVTLEENRGELPAELSKVASQIMRFCGGTQHFVNLLAALGDTGFNRGYVHYYQNHGEPTKKESLSQLIQRCQPGPEDTPERLREALKQAKIPEKRVIQAAVYAPQWAGLLEKAMDVAGLKCGVWFFHAHINENFSAAKETEVAIYSAVSPQQFNDGAFDKDWFYEAYHSLGDKRFNELYKNAKYITSSSNNHRRSQLYVDAVLGRLDKDEVKAEIISKRNQEKLRAYPLIPLDENMDNDALERYEFIQGFKKESRQYGSLRQASEGKACATAMENLAITTGYGDADRMTWAMEGAKIEQLRPLMEPHTLGDTEVGLSIGEDGTPELIIRKNGKPIKTMPKELAKDPYIAGLKESVKQLRDQKRRAKASFEMAMVSRSGFSVAELVGLLNHPVLRSMASSLVFVAHGGLGFPALADGALLLTGHDGKSFSVEAGDQILIAHPYDFIAHGCWSDFQKHVYHSKIIQPFKQVFREYYPATEDELSAVNISRRYAGNQVQPKKAVALLKTRGWTADYDVGLQRVWHKENLIARMYALADWFSPADIEAPTLETVQFFSRDKYGLAPFADIPPVIFSETMRDIDLAVSVAHAGGVDPEASHSTVEMRIAIAQELLSMLSVSNVSFQSSHAQIKGRLGEYSVHMGSGIVHKSGTGMVAVLPVHSQARGRIFLPFADDDPKTAEIMSKILLLAEDKKIKDPGILKQIVG